MPLRMQENSTSLENVKKRKKAKLLPLTKDDLEKKFSLYKQGADQPKQQKKLKIKKRSKKAPDTMPLLSPQSKNESDSALSGGEPERHDREEPGEHALPANGLSL